MSTPDDPILHRARALFEAQAEAVDGPTATALRARRRDALATRPRRRHSPWWWPASGMATAALAVVLWLPRTGGPTADPAPPGGANGPVASTPALPTPAEPTVALPLEAEAARFADTALVELEDDAEFYAWLATVPDDAGRPTDTPALPDTGPNEGLTL